MDPLTTSAFDLPPTLAAKADPSLIGADDRHLAEVAAALGGMAADVDRRLREAVGTGRRIGQEAMDRDLQVHRLQARSALLQRIGLDACIGRMVLADGDTLYVGRIGVADVDGHRLLVDWRSPAAERFFAATPAQPMGVRSRRRYRWTRGRITDYWDEALVPDGVRDRAALDDASAFVVSLGASRSPRMRDVLATIQADQDAIIRAGARGALVVDGGPGTGKTVVALHRAAYLLYADPRLGAGRGGVLVVGPHEPYLAYVEDVLPSLGEDEVRTCTVRDLVPEGRTALPEADARVHALKSSGAMSAVIEAAVSFYEDPPTEALGVSTDWADLRLDVADWAAAFTAPEPGTPHNEARDQVWEAIVELLAEQAGDGVPVAALRRELAQDDELVGMVRRAWPRVDATDVVADLWSVPAYLRRCAPWLTADEVALLQRAQPYAWTIADLPLLDAARHRLGDPRHAARRQQEKAAVAAERARMDLVVDELLLADDDGMYAQLRQPGLRDALVDGAAVPSRGADRLDGPFAHVVVDEAQELTDAEWQMVLRRCPSGSLTVVGDRAQARHGFAGTWVERLAAVGVGDVRVRTLTINYRTPAEIMAAAEPVIRAVLPDANVPRSVRRGGLPVAFGGAADLDAVVDAWERSHPEGIGAVVGAPAFEPTARVRSLPPSLTKGLEFDLVVLVDPAAFGPGIEGAVDRYVAMTRATQQLIVLTS